MNAQRRRINGYIWNEQMARANCALADIRKLTADIITALDLHPVSVRLLLTYAAQIALHLNTAAEALRQLEIIAATNKE